MQPAIRAAVDTLLSRQDLSESDTRAAVSAIMDGDCNEVETAAFLTALRMQGETVDEIVGAARAMRDRSAPIPTAEAGLLDTCGTGGDGLRTFNISTAAAIVAAACGVPVAKHGNRSVSSSSGSADVLERLGVRIDLSPDAVAECITEIGLGFCFAPLFHGAMKHAAPVRKALGFQTIFNLLGPLTNPAKAPFQLLGARSNVFARMLAEAALRLGTERTIVVCGADQLDEVALWGSSTALFVEDGAIRRETWSPEDLGLAPCRVDELVVADADASAEMIQKVFAGADHPARRMVAANTGAALLATGMVPSIRAGADLAVKAIDEGLATVKLDRLVEFTQNV